MCHSASEDLHCNQNFYPDQYQNISTATGQISQNSPFHVYGPDLIVTGYPLTFHMCQTTNWSKCPILHIQKSSSYTSMKFTEYNHVLKLYCMKTVHTGKQSHINSVFAHIYAMYCMNTFIHAKMCLFSSMSCLVSFWEQCVSRSVVVTFVISSLTWCCVIQSFISFIEHREGTEASIFSLGSKCQ